MAKLLESRKPIYGERTHENVEKAKVRMKEFEQKHGIRKISSVKELKEANYEMISSVLTELSAKLGKNMSVKDITLMLGDMDEKNILAFSEGFVRGLMYSNLKIDSFEESMRERIDELIFDNKRALEMSVIIREQKSVVDAMNNNNTRIEELRKILGGRNR